ncbi:hypothetical protein SSX86_028032 [Deinandra increscens subsp. villosa]|uniref:No apical meristem-associated C-terminal domain-containing protein n=1 Tax=Deinandra increscens subsp. villosa TaxID=3103831 RepID=A0AAP0GKY2_9ASTR
MDPRKKNASTSAPKKFRPKVRSNTGQSSTNRNQQPFYVPSPPIISQPQPVYYPPQPPQQQSFNDLLRFGHPDYFQQYASSAQQSYQNTQFREPRRLVDEASDSEEMDEEIEVDEEEVEEEQHVEIEEEVEEEEEEEEEMEEEPPARRTQARKNKKKSTTKADRTPWTTDEKKYLAQAYIHVTEDKKVGDQQRFSSFWQRVVDHFIGLIGRETNRNVHQITTKWKNLNKKLMNFGGLIAQFEHARASGAGDLDVWKLANTEYEKIYEKKGFTHVSVWEVVKDHPKWKAPRRKVGGVSEPKRTKTSVSGEYTTSNEVDSTQLPSRLPDLNEDSPPPLPQRKSRTKSGESSKDGSSNALEVMNRFESKWEKEKEAKAAIREKTAERKAMMYAAVKETMENEKRARDLEIFLRPTENVPTSLLPTLLAEKRRIAALHNWECDF